MNYIKNDYNIRNEELNRALSDIPVRSRPVIRQGNSGEWVSFLQRELTNLTFYNGPINGTFDAATNTAVRAFQQNNRLLVDGIVGINTWSALIYLYSPLAICGGGDIQAGTYTVVVGDTLFSIATRFNTTVEELRQYNNLASNNLTVGQTLRIPGTVGSGNPSPPVNRPTIRQGDSGEAVRELQRLLNDLGYNTGWITGIFGPLTNTAVRAFQATNNLSVDGIVGPITWGALLQGTTPPPPVNPPPGETQTYTVVAGDTLFSIAQRFNTSVAEIVSLNNLTSMVLSVGQQLLIPGGSNVYTVVAGDTLFSIAQRFNTTVNEIIALNNLTSSSLSIGQQLLIPNRGAFSVQIYTVVAGDTLFSIAKRFSTSVNNLMQLNNMTSNAISIGQQLWVPV